MGTNEKVELLRKTPIFANLAERDLDVVGRYCEFCDYRKVEIIFSEGSRNKELYVIGKGEVLIRKTTDEGTSKDLARFITGESFGELDLLDTAPMPATASAEVDTTLLVFPVRRLSLADVIHGHPEVFAVMLGRLLAVVAGRIRTANKLISEKTPWVQELRKQILIDKLTGLFNRTYLEEELETLLSRTGRETGLLVIKPDNFKQINDTYGHGAGDDVLKLMAGVVRGVSAEGAAAVRYRGDEFAVVLPGADIRAAAEKGEAIRTAFKSMRIGQFTGGSPFTITASIGAAAYPVHASDGTSLTSRAHALMLEARNAGGDRVALPGENEGATVDGEADEN